MQILLDLVEQEYRHESLEAVLTKQPIGAGRRTLKISELESAGGFLF